MTTQLEPKKSRLAVLAGRLLAPAIWLERARGRRRVGLSCLYILVTGVCGFFLWWSTRLNGLPDIGVPFDASKFDRVSVPDNENAFVLYRKLGSLYVPLDQASYVQLKAGPRWSQAAPKIRDWVNANREALALWMKGAERPRALYIPPAELKFDSHIEVVQQLRDLIRVAGLEGTRLEESGDLDGAWRIYRAMLRSSRHVGVWGFAVQRLIGIHCLRMSTPRILAWAETPRVSAQQLRAALDEVVACEAMTPPASESLEIEFLSMTKAFGEPERWIHDDLSADKYWYRHMRGGLEAELFLFREPERSRRVGQLVLANWLAYCDRPANQRPRTVTEVYLFAPDSNGPAKARALTPEAIERWHESTVLAKQFLPGLTHYLRALDGERGVFAGLKVHLAEQLYLREHGKPPQKLGDLVGPYLKHLPDGYDDVDIPLADPAEAKPARVEPRTK